MFIIGPAYLSKLAKRTCQKFLGFAIAGQELYTIGAQTFLKIVFSFFSTKFGVTNKPIREGTF